MAVVSASQPPGPRVDYLEALIRKYPDVNAEVVLLFWNIPDAEQMQAEVGDQQAVLKAPGQRAHFWLRTVGAPSL